MKLIATLRTDHKDQLYAELRGSGPEGDLCGVVTDAGDMTRPFRDQVNDWAREHGHEITRFKLEALV